MRRATDQILLTFFPNHRGKRDAIMRVMARLLTIARDETRMFGVVRSSPPIVETLEVVRIRKHIISREGKIQYKGFLPNFSTTYVFYAFRRANFYATRKDIRVSMKSEREDFYIF